MRSRQTLNYAAANCTARSVFLAWAHLLRVLSILSRSAADRMECSLFVFVCVGVMN